MKIGILTLHSQLNYGGVLQCLALNDHLRRLGHEVYVLDITGGRANWNLYHGFDRMGVRGWIRFWWRSAWGLGDYAWYLRIRRTVAVLNRRLTLLPYSPGTVNPTAVALDCIVVGSDQVWHVGNWGNPRLYLLEGAPAVKAVAYAASFGMDSIPSGNCGGRPWREIFAEGLGKFAAISCRERSGVEICQGFGIAAQQVLDPSLLLVADEWRSVFGLAQCGGGKRKLIVGYFIAENLEVMLPELDAFCAEHDCEALVLVNEPPATWWLPFPIGAHAFRSWLGRIRRKCASVRVSISAGPREFLAAIDAADFVVSDSFHALMFSMVFGKNVRILRPSTPGRQRMFARIAEIAERTHGPLVQSGIGEALLSFARGETVEFDHRHFETLRQGSRSFLEGCLFGD